MGVERQLKDFDCGTTLGMVPELSSESVARTKDLGSCVSPNRDRLTSFQKRVQDDTQDSKSAATAATHQA